MSVEFDADESIPGAVVVGMVRERSRGGKPGAPQ
jgi:hypothetical protein